MGSRDTDDVGDAELVSSFSSCKVGNMFRDILMYDILLVSPHPPLL